MATSKKNTTAAVNALALKLATLSKSRCKRLLHMFVAGSPPSVSPGCVECAKVREMHEAWVREHPPAAAPRPTPTEPRRQMLEDVPTFPPESHPSNP